MTVESRVIVSNTLSLPGGCRALIQRYIEQTRQCAPHRKQWNAQRHRSRVPRAERAAQRPVAWRHQRGVRRPSVRVRCADLAAPSISSDRDPPLVPTQHTSAREAERHQSFALNAPRRRRRLRSHKESNANHRASARRVARAIAVEIWVQGRRVVQGQEMRARARVCPAAGVAAYIPPAPRPRG